MMRVETATAASVSTMRISYLWLEFTMVFFLIPLVYAFHHSSSPLFFLLVLCMVSGVMLYRSPDFRNVAFTNKAGWLKDIGRVLRQFTYISVALFAITWIFLPGQLFYCIKCHPDIWLSLMVIYPLLSVYPQELIYRAFLFHRYRPLVTNEKNLMHFSALAFAFGHIIYFHPISIALTLMGGYLFSWTYVKTKSLLAVSFEHALYGCLLYTIGLGRYFYTGFDKLLS